VADTALFEALRRHLDPAISLLENDAAINDEWFAEACANQLIKLIET
jgi:uncharacterized protein (UPF0261 family)